MKVSKGDISGHSEPIEVRVPDNVCWFEYDYWDTPQCKLASTKHGGHWACNKSKCPIWVIYDSLRPTITEEES